MKKIYIEKKSTKLYLYNSFFAFPDMANAYICNVAL